MLKLWKYGMKAKRLRVDKGKTKVLVSGPYLNRLKYPGKFPCGVCKRGMASSL